MLLDKVLILKAFMFLHIPRIEILFVLVCLEKCVNEEDMINSFFLK
jgi:hypothetical protein